MAIVTSAQHPLLKAAVLMPQERVVLVLAALILVMAAAMAVGQSITAAAVLVVMPVTAVKPVLVLRGRALRKQGLAVVAAVLLPETATETTAAAVVVALAFLGKGQMALLARKTGLLAALVAQALTAERVIADMAHLFAA